MSSSGCSWSTAPIAGVPGRSPQQPPAPARRTYVRVCRGVRRRDRSPAERRTAQESLEAGAGRGCVARRNRRRGRWRRPPAAGRDWDRGRTNTTASRSATGRLIAGGAGRRRVREPGRSSRQTGAALGPTGLQDRATASGAHPRTETVLAGSTSIVGLIGTLHGDLRNLRDNSCSLCGRRRQRPSSRLTSQGYGRRTTSGNRADQTTSL